MLLDITGKTPQKKVTHIKRKSDIKTKTEKFKLKHQKIIKNIGEIFDIPKKDEVINILTNNQFNAYSFIPYILSKQKIKKLYVITYFITPTVIENLSNYAISGEVEELYLYVSDHILRRRERTAKMLIELFDKYDNIKIGFAFSHAKITIMDNFVITGSGNMNKNSRIEQYMFFNNQDIADFFKSAFFQEFKITEKTRKDLYEV